MSFQKKFFSFDSVWSCSFKIAFLLHHKLKLKFCCQSCDPIFPPKPLKSKNKNHTIVWNTKFYNPANFELKRIKTAKVIPRVPFQAFCWPGVLGQDSELKVQQPGGTLKITIGITGLQEILVRDYRIDKHYWGPSTMY